VKADKQQDLDQSRRNAMKKMAYIPPAVFTLSAMPFSASYGSSGSQDGDAQGGDGDGNQQ
jgi:hypothetical protein